MSEAHSDDAYPGLSAYCAARDNGLRTTEARLEAEVPEERGKRYERYWRNSRKLPPGNVGPSFGSPHITRTRGAFN